MLEVRYKINIYLDIFFRIHILYCFNSRLMFFFNRASYPLISSSLSHHINSTNSSNVQYLSDINGKH